MVELNDENLFDLTCPMQEIKKVNIFFIFKRLPPGRNIVVYGPSSFKSIGDVKIISLHKLYNLKARSSNLDLFELIIPRTFKELGGILKDYKHTKNIAIINLKDSIRYVPVIFFLKKYNYLVVGVNLKYIPLKYSIGSAKNMTKLKSILYCTIRLIKLYTFPKYDMFLVSAGYKINNNAFCGSGTKILKFPCLDYFRFLMIRSEISEYEDEIGVFIDQDLPHNSDYKRFKNWPVTEVKYYRDLERWFKHIMEKFGLSKVIILAHPKTDISIVKRNFLDNRIEVCANKTIEYIAVSKIVICHFSTAILYAILFNKPLLFISTSELEDKIEYDIIKDLADTFRRKVNTMDNLYKTDLDVGIDIKAYKNYYNNYINPSKYENEQFHEIFYKEVVKNIIFSFNENNSKKYN